MLFSDESKKSGEMPVMRCDTHQGQLWMQHEEVTTTSEYSLRQSLPVRRAKQMRYALDDKESAQLQMAEHGSATTGGSSSSGGSSTTTNNSSGSKVLQQQIVAPPTLNKRPVNAICERLRNNSALELDGSDATLAVRPLDAAVDDDDEDDDDSMPSSADDSLDANDDTEDGMEVSGFGDDSGSCDNNDPMENDVGDATSADEEDVAGAADGATELDDYGRGDVRLQQAQNGSKEGMDCEDDDEDDDDALEDGLGRNVGDESSDGARVAKKAKMVFEDDFDAKYNTLLAGVQDCFLRNSNCKDVADAPVTNCERRTRSPPAAGAAVSAAAKGNNSLVKTERRNKRKNFKPRNIVYQQYDICEDGDGEFLPDYAGSCWDASPTLDASRLLLSSKDDEEDDEECNSLLDRTASAAAAPPSPPPSFSAHASKSFSCDTELPEVAGSSSSNADAADQPLDLSDCASTTKRTLLTSRRTPTPLHLAQPFVSKESETGDGIRRSPSELVTPVGTIPMDLTVNRGTPPESAMGKSAADHSALCDDAMDLSKGPALLRRSSPSFSDGAEPNYATSLTTVPPTTSSQSAAVTSNASVYRHLAAAGRNASLMGAPSMSGLTGISASLLGLHGGDLMSPTATHSSASMKAAAAAAAAHVAALGLAQAVRSREEGHDGATATSVPTAIDESAMKDYAESTMKELLGLYGINDMAESITKDVPLPNFSSVKILENMAPTLGLLPHIPPTSSPLSHPVPQPAVTTITTTTTCTSSSAATVTMTTTALPIPLVPSHSRPQVAHSSTSMVSSSGRSSASTPSTVAPQSSGNSGATPVSSHSSDDLYESLHSQMVVDSVAKLASLSSNNIIGNPRVILPHNMSTILAVAALQKSKSQGASSSSTPLTSHMGHHRSKSASLVNPPSAHLLGSRGHHGLGAGTAHLSTSLFKEHGKVSPVDYTRYVKRFSSSTECGHNSCKDLNYREHFHCLDCNSRVFVKKEEMIRHFKWHKKRDESLQHGFLRYSPMDDCSERYPNCAHNRKQTHYHCVKENCDKVYISTSDVQMHANYHRKDSAIIQEGFQRFRATEDCATSYCSFAGQRTTHFHCRRPSCNFTFKNKADMEKHKSYHIKDEQLNKDGFKKFMKHEHCSFENCRFSRVCNHIHCIRPGCTYVLHSSGQLYSHKRKHERRETEMAYRKFKLAQSMMRTLGENQVLALQSFGDEIKASEAFSGQLPMPMIPGAPGGLPVSLTPPSTHGLTPDSTTLSFTDAVQQSFTSALLAAGGSQHLDSALATHGLVPGADQLGMMDFTAELLKSRMDDSWKKYLSRYTANDPCKVHCEYIYKDHYHCNAENCNLVFRSKDGVREHARNHETQDQVTEAFYTTVDVGQNGSCPPDCPHQGEERHYHCGWHGCREIIMATDKPFRRLDHYKMHDYAQKLNFTKEFSTKDPLSLHFASSIEGIFKRKRGRPPKNRVIEFPVSSGSADFPQAIYTSFKLPKSNNLPMMSLLEKGFPSGSSALSASGASSMSKSMMSSVPSMLSPLGYLTQNIIHPKVEMQDGFYVFPEGASCPLPACPLYGKLHYHCAQSRCFYVTERSDILLLHSKDFHENIDIMEGFVFFDRSVDCRLPGCQSNRVNRHFHCTRPNCHYSFVRYSTMSQHDDKHRNAEGGGAAFGGGPVPPLCTSVGVTTNSLVCSSSGAAYPLKRSPVHQTKMECPSPPTITSPGTQLSEPRTTPSPGSSNGKPTVVKATGTYYPLSAFPQSYRTKEGTKPASSSRATSTSDAATDTEPVPGSNASEPDLTAGRLAAEWQILLESHVAYSADKSCGRPFCKLHNRDHVHCTYCNKAFSKLMQLQPHIQKHLQGAMSPTGTSSRMTNSEDDLSDHRLDDDDDDDLGLGGEARRLNDHEETSDDSNCSSGRFPSHLRSSPSTDSTPSSQHLPYSASFLAASTGHPVGGDLFPTFPASVSGTLGAQFAVPGNGENHGRISPLQPPPPPPPQQQQPLPQHNGGSGGEFDAEHSSHDSTGGGSGMPSPVDSLDSDTGASPPLLSAGAVSGQVVPGGVGGSRKRMAAVAHDSSSSAAAITAAKIPCLRLLKDEPVPHGYVRYRFNEDCQYSHCGYREHQTHFHCMRKDCGYSFCDKTRFVQHTARHERLDTLMGGDFQQFRANVSCGRPACVYSAPPTAGANKASHFHCFKCDFVCTDTNKVVAHRRQHQKLDTIMAAGFEKFTATQPCGVDGCSHNQRQTHYHCLKCQYAVLGLSQMSAHKYRHLE